MKANPNPNLADNPLAAGDSSQTNLAANDPLDNEGWWSNWEEENIYRKNLKEV